MRILFLGDVYGRSGRDAIAKHLPELREELDFDALIINGDNAAHGRGITEIICEDFYEMGADCITAGDHVWDQREIISYINRDKKLLRPDNYKSGTPGSGYFEKTLLNGCKLIVLHLQGRIFMKNADCPFTAAESFVNKHKLKPNTTIIVDFHAEATSEKMGMAQFLDGKVSAVVGSHTHIPTADNQILPNGTGFHCDAGMCGDYDSVIGAEKEGPVDHFVKSMPRTFKPADGEGTVCGTFIVTNDQTGFCTRIEPVRIGGRLSPFIPQV